MIGTCSKCKEKCLVLTLPILQNGVKPKQVSNCCGAPLTDPEGLGATRLRRYEMVKLDESTDYLLESGETTGFLKHLPGCGQVEGDCPEDDPQPWLSEKLDWWFAVDGTSGPGLEFHERRIIGVVGTQSERDEIETPGGKLPYRGPR